MSRLPVLFLLLILPGLATSASALEAGDAEWVIEAGQIELEFDPGILKALSLDIEDITTDKKSASTLVWTFLQNPNVAIIMRDKSFRSLGPGHISLGGSIRLIAGKRKLSASGFAVRRGKTALSLELVGPDGEAWFSSSSYQYHFDPGLSHLFMHSMGFEAGPGFSAFTGRAIDGMVLGRARLALRLQALQGGQAKGTGTVQCINPRWHDGSTYLTDVRLTDIPVVMHLSGEDGQGNIRLAPTAYLDNVGTADVPWFQKFASRYVGSYPPPYNEDSHPMLVWNLYRLVDGRMEQIGKSGLKHAFNTVNHTCSCAGGAYYSLPVSPFDPENLQGAYSSILWATDHDDNLNGLPCEDNYQYSTNDEARWLGPRAEVTPHSVDWEPCGSSFSPDAVADGTPCAETATNPYPGAFPNYRMWVAPADLTVAGASYYLDAWYLVKNDIDIFNSMGWVSINPVDNALFWSFDISPSPGFQNGSILDNWVDPGAPAAGESNHTLNTGQGHLQLASRVEDLGNGSYRYDYALMSHDFSPGLRCIRIPAAGTDRVSNIEISDGDRDPGNDWQIDQKATYLVLRLPGNTPHDFGQLHSLRFTSTIAPVDGEIAIASARQVLYTNLPAKLPGDSSALPPGGSFESCH